MINEQEFDYIITHPPLGHSEHHFNKYPEHPWLKTRYEIEFWLNNEVVANMYQINKDLSVSIFDGKFYLKNRVDYLPVKFRYVKEMNLNRIKIKSLIGIPYSSKSLHLNGNDLDSLKELKVNSYIDYMDVSENKLKNFIGFPKARAIVLNNNPIESWDGFKECENIFWWQDKWCESTSYNLLMNAPNVIRNIIVSSNFDSYKILKEGGQNGQRINMSWLRSEQNKIKRANNLNCSISDSLDMKSKESKKRKL